MADYEGFLGQRYVFFKELYITNPSFANTVQSHFSSINSLFTRQTKEDEKENETMDYMTAYLFFLKNLAENERASENAYLQKQLSIIDKDKHFKKSTIGKKLYKIFSTKTKNFDYLQQINLLNSLKQDNDEYRKNIELMKKRLDKLNDLKKIENDIVPQLSDFIDELYVENYRKYRIFITDSAEYMWNDIAENNSIAEDYNKKIQKIFKTCFKDNKIISIINSHLKKINLNTNIIELIRNLVVDYVINNITEDNFDQWLEKNIEEKINKATKMSSHRVFIGNKNNKSIEEYAITSNKDLANKIIMAGEEAEEILNSYEPNQDGPAHLAWEQLKKDKNNSVKKGQLTKELNIIFEKIIKEKINKLNIKLEDSDDIRKLTQEQKQLILNSFDKLHIINNINTAITATSSGPSSIAEILADPATQGRLKDYIISFTPGTKINLKNDIVFTANFNPPTINLKPNRQKLKNLTDNFLKDFMIKYKEKSGGETNTKAAKEIYINKINELKEQYDKALEEAKNEADQQQALIQLLQETFFGGVSVKEYRYLNNSLGFHGGSLGGGGKVVPVINNIIDMYNAGGLKAIDPDVIIEAILNCSESMIGGSVIDLEAIKNYLIGGAAMLMFDEGFANTQPFLDKMKENFGNAAPKTVHLYFLNGLYVPASYVLQNIYENLSQLVGDIRLTSDEVKSSLYIQNNISYQPEENLTWNEYSTKAQNGVTIQFLFMAGILDIFEKLPEAFQI